jgi:hypothetical protein
MICRPRYPPVAVQKDTRHVLEVAWPLACAARSSQIRAPVVVEPHLCTTPKARAVDNDETAISHPQNGTKLIQLIRGFTFHRADAHRARLIKLPDTKAG